VTVVHIGATPHVARQVGPAPHMALGEPSWARSPYLLASARAGA